MCNAMGCADGSSVSCVARVLQRVHEHGLELLQQFTCCLHRTCTSIPPLHLTPPAISNAAPAWISECQPWAAKLRCSGGGRTRCAACIKAKRGRCGTVQAGADCQRRRQAEQSMQQQTHAEGMFAGANGQAAMHLPGMMAEVSPGTLLRSCSSDATCPAPDAGTVLK